MDDLLCVAKLNLEMLRENPYPGRGIVIGVSEDKNLIQVYWIMGRKEKSRNRVFEKDETGRLWTAPADPSKVDEADKDSSLIFYTAIDEVLRLNAVSNGAQTDSIIGGYRKTLAHADEAFHRALFGYKYEPDFPNYTPRISAMFFLTIDPEVKATICHAEMSIIKKSPWNDDVGRSFFTLSKFTRGIGFCLTTYEGDGDPLPAFEGFPYPLPLEGGMETILKTFWEVLNEENRVSIAVKSIDIQTGAFKIEIINKYKKVPAE
jgi:IMP cyclohydrolase